MYPRMIGACWLFTHLQLHEMLSAELPGGRPCWRRYVGQLSQQLFVGSESILHRREFRVSQRKKEALAERVEKQSRVRILDAIRKKLPDVLSRPDLEMVILDYFRRLGHDNHRRHCKVYGWEEKKSKASWGAQIVDYEKISATAVEAMTSADLHRFLVVCALASDLYCPGYNPKQSLAKDSNLARTAGRYKIDLAKVGATVRAELTKKKETKAATKKSKTSPNSSSARREPSKATTTK